MEEKKSIPLPGITTLKYTCELLLTVLAVSSSGTWGGLVAALAELAAIFCVSNMILLRWKIPGWVTNGVLLLLYNTQMLVMLFGSTFISSAMITNLDSIEDLGGKIGIYGLGVVLVLLISFMPARAVSPVSISFPRAPERNTRYVHTSWSGILSAVLAIELVFTLIYGSGSSPLFAYFTLGREMRAVSELRSSISASSEDMTMHFWDYADYNFREKPDNLPEKPNVILILTEGLSQNIIDDERNIMPNVASYREKSLSFARYYNHTFATYRGIIGQLYSGYQLENYDTNSLVSVQEAFRKNGYHTSVINTEPVNVNFGMYLESMHFDEVVMNTDLMADGTAKTLSDKQAYEVLYDEVSEKHSEGVPFMTMIYTFGTHVSLDSPDEKFGDGSDRLLNKFYNLDCQFGSFMEKLKESGILEDTIVVFTADHCTYADSDFVSAFPDIHRAHTECGQMPLFIYYKGVTPEEVDVNGRNSLDLAPTLLDYLDIHVGNYFLGFTLFADDQTSANMTSFDRIFSDSAVHVSTTEGMINPLTEVQEEVFLSELEKYYIAKSQKRLK